MGRLRSVLCNIAHVLYGILTAFAPWHLSFIMFLAFLVYELDEEFHIRDKAYEDILEYMIGLSIGAAIYLLSNHIIP